jgi:hypothetical protein
VYNNTQPGMENISGKDRVGRWQSLEKIDQPWALIRLECFDVRDCWRSNCQSLIKTFVRAFFDSPFRPENPLAPFHPQPPSEGSHLQS